MESGVMEEDLVDLRKSLILGALDSPGEIEGLLLNRSVSIPNVHSLFIFPSLQ